MGRNRGKKNLKSIKPGPRRRARKLLGWFFFLFFGGGATLLYLGEKYADDLPGYQAVRAKIYTWRDQLLRDPERTITISSAADAAASPYDNLKLGIPGPATTILDRPYYALGYAESVEQPLWVAYTLTADEVRNKAATRTDDFRVDPYVPTGSARPEDYAKSGYDRGHLVPAADLAWSKRSMSESFYFSNMSPQRPDFNRGVWRLLEEKVRDWAVDHEHIHVVTGPVFAGPSITVGRNKVVVPKAYYKVIYAPAANPPRMLGFLLPNDKSARPLHEFAVTVNAVEAAARLDFFPLLPPAEKDHLKSSIDINVWKWTPNRKGATDEHSEDLF